MLDSIDYYNRYAVPYYESTIDLDMSEIMQPFLEELPENAEVLDLGCGSGRDSLVLEEQGCLVTSLDGSEEMCKLAEIYLDRPVLHMLYEEMEFDQVFDGIWACASLVHLTPEEMKETLKKLLAALKPFSTFPRIRGIGEELIMEDISAITPDRNCGISWKRSAAAR